MQISKHCEEENSLLKEKLRDLEDRSRRDNLRIDGLPEMDNETWLDSEETLKKLFSSKLGINNVQIERAHRVGKTNANNKKHDKRIVAKFASYKMKQAILTKANSLKRTAAFT